MAQRVLQQPSRSKNGGSWRKSKVDNIRSSPPIWLWRRFPSRKVVQSQGRILLLGPLFDSLTILHHAEHIAAVPNKKTKRYQWPILRDGKCEWIKFEQFDTSGGIVDWPDGDYFLRIVEEYMTQASYATGQVGAADSYLFDARDLTDFVVAWLEKHFG